MNFEKMTIIEAHNGLKKKQFSSVELTKFYLKKIKAKDKDVSAFLEVDEKVALSSAEAADKEILSGKISFLTGIPLAVKDNILTKGFKATCGSKMLKNYSAPYDATVIKKLKSQKAIILGKTNLDEFAMGSSTENSAFFPTKNPYDLKRVPGGSSGGSAAAVASDMCVYALGSDTGGSIRQPASFCGVVGLKPTYGSVSRYGLVAFASSLDQIGPITKTIKEAEIVFEAIKGKDPLDSTSVVLQKDDLDSEVKSIKDIKVGVPKEYFVKGTDKRILSLIAETIKKLKGFGVKIEEISLPSTKYIIPVYYLICTSEASSNLARYDGIKYGCWEKKSLAEKTKNLLDVYFENRKKGFGKEVKRRIMLGTFALSAGYYDAYYLKAQKVRNLIKSDFERAFKKVDLILSSTSPVMPFNLGEKIFDPLSMYLCDIFTASANLTGLPAASIPAGFVDNLPVGVQIIGRLFRESDIFKIGKLIES